MSGCHNIYALFHCFFILLFFTLGANKELTLSMGPPASYAIFQYARRSTLSSASFCTPQTAHCILRVMFSMLNSFFSLSLYLTDSPLCFTSYFLNAQLFLQPQFVPYRQPTMLYALCARCSIFVILRAYLTGDQDVTQAKKGFIYIYIYTHIYIYIY